MESDSSLSSEQLAALVDAAEHGRLSDDGLSGSNGGARRNQRVRPVDFSRPTKFTSDHQRRIARAIDTFCQTAVTRLATELRVPLELETINTMQLTWSAAQAQLPPGSLSVMINTQPIGTRMLLTIEQSFVLLALECLLGGNPDRPPRERRLSEIDWRLTRRLIASITAQMSVVWQEMAGITLQAADIDAHSDAIQIASASEPTYVVVIEVRLNKQSSAMELVIPWIAIEPVQTRVSGRARMREEDDSHGEGPAVKRVLTGAPITLRAEVASCQMAVADILALAPGSIVRFGQRADQGVTLYAENVRLGRAQPGAHGTKRAVQIRGIERGVG